MGIIVPLAGIAATLFVGNRHGSAADEKPPAVAGAPSASPGASDSSDQADSPGPKKPKSRVLFGPGAVQFQTSSYGVDIDLDSSKPLVGDDLRGGDLTAIADGGGTAGSTNFHGGPQLAATIALLSGNGADPTEAECAEALRRNGDPMLQNPPQHARFCVQTTEGRTAFVRITSAAPGGHSMKLTVTVWDLSA
ncbi:hypothetical protein [Streptomyces sp. NPDC001401]|uniref:hypothetical protein n=1 Tax=Streptomyces sp. NPDC001401 TaxID=3364570 RepID=UPI003683F65F